MISISCYVVGQGVLAISCLNVLLESHWRILGICSHDSALESWAIKFNVPYFSCSQKFCAHLVDVNFDYLFSIHNYWIIPEKIIHLAQRCTINIHNSCLPKYAGLYATSWALINGETQHGITWHEVDSKIDTGRIIKQVNLPVFVDDTAYTLNLRCFDAAVASFNQLVQELITGCLEPYPQDLAQRSYFGGTKRPEAACLLSFHKSTKEICNLVRALDFGTVANPLGLAKIWLIGGVVAVKSAQALTVSFASQTSPGQVLKIDESGLSVATTDGAVLLSQLITLDGQVLSVETLVTEHNVYVGNIIPEPDLNLKEVISKHHSLICRYESAWVNHLINLAPFRHPYLSNSTPDRLSNNQIHRYPISLPAQRVSPIKLLTIFAAYCARLTKDFEFDLGLQTEAQRSVAPEIFSQRVPLRVKVDPDTTFSQFEVQLAKNLEKISVKGNYALDIVSRYPELRKFAAVDELSIAIVIAHEPEQLDWKSFRARMCFVAYANGSLPELIHAGELSNLESTAIVNQLQNLIHACLINPETLLYQLPMLSKSERLKLTEEWNNTSIEYPQHLCIHQLFEEQVERTPDAVAVVFEEQQLTYQELNSRANQLAHYLKDLGVGPEVLVGICVERSVEMVVGLLGILKAGGAYIPLDPTYPIQRLQFMLNDAEVSVLVTMGPWAIQTDHPLKVVCLDRQEVLGNPYQQNPDWVVSAINLAYVIYTSGSTGIPKGVLIEHRSLVNFTCAAINQYQIRPHDRVLQFASLSFDGAAEEIYPCLSQGGTLVLCTPEMRQSIPVLIQKSRVWQVTVWDLPAAFWHLLVSELVKENLRLPESLRLIITGGEEVFLDRVLTWHQQVEQAPQLMNSYGPTEATIVATLSQLSHYPFSRQVIDIGRPISNVQAYILDQSLQPVPVGIPGELHIGGAGLARGYLNRPDLTAEKFIANPFKEGRLYKTGDLARYLPDGRIEYLGRIDHQVKIRGFRIELGEIEAVLSRHERVQQCVVIVREDPPDNKILLAYVVAGEVEVNALREFLKQQLPEYMVPSTFVRLEALPLTPNGKIDRRSLPAPSDELSRTDTLIPPQSERQILLALLFADVLNRPAEQIGLQDNFFDLGGHSLLATQLVSRLRQTFAIELPLQTLFESPTVAGLDTVLSQHRSRELPLPQIVPMDRKGKVMPLSFAQERLWFLAQLEGTSATYNIPFAIQIDGELDVAALQEAITQLIHRHETLRTTFPAQDGVASQQIDPTRQISLQVLEASTLDLPLAEWLQQEAQLPFNLETDPLLRVTLVRVQEQRAVLAMTMHHIISDGWSMGVLIRELSCLYSAYHQGQPSPLSPLPIQYADYTLWQRQWLQGEVLETQLSYWKQQLADAPALLELPTDHPRPAVQTFRGHTLPVTVPLELSQQVKKLAQRQGVTLFMLLLAVFQLLLHRYSGQSDILVGTPIANRQRTELESLIGFFVNTLVLRAQMKESDTAADLLDQVRQVALDAYAHQDVPFEQVVEALQPERTLAYSPLFQVMFVLQNAPMSTLEMSGVRLTPLALESKIAKFDLTLSMKETTQGLVGYWQYNSGLFEAETITRMAGHFETLLRGMVENVIQPISTIPLLSEFERHQLLVEWNNTTVEYPHHLCIHQLFEEQVEKIPDAIAIVFENQHLTYAELNTKANQLARYLQGLGVGPEVLVGICAKRSLEMIVGLLGILKAGGAYVPLDPENPPARLNFLLRDLPVQVLLTQADLLASLPPQTIPVFCLDRDWSTLGVTEVADLDTPTQPENLAYVIYTSGSTGVPKAVAVPHQAVNRLVLNTNYIHLTAEDRIAQAANLAFDAATFEIWGALLNGGRVVILDKAVVLAPEELTAYLARQKITTLFLTTALFNQLAHSVPHAFAGLKSLLFGGEAVEPKWVQAVLEKGAPANFIHVYGPTESTTFASWHRVEAVSADALTIPIGIPLANTQLYILDAYLQLVAVGIPGELHIGGAGLARGYLNRPDLTAEKFIANPFKEGRLYKTGDLARYLPDGRIEYLGRIDHQVKIRGFRIELGEIEAVLSRHERVQQCVVIVREDPPDNKILLAYVVAGEVEVNALREFLKQQLPEYMVPSTFVRLEALPLTLNGKVDRRALPLPSAEKLNQSDFAPPQTADQIMLARLFAESLHLPVEQIGLNDNFFELGGHSLLAVQLIHRINKALAQDLKLADLFSVPTIAGLSRKLSGSAPPQTFTGQFLNIMRAGQAGATPVILVGGFQPLKWLLQELPPQLPIGWLHFRYFGQPFAPVIPLSKLAEHYTEELMAAFPTGRLILLGFSLGGLIALDVMQRLHTQHGRQVHGLLLEPTPPRGVTEAHSGNNHAISLPPQSRFRALRAAANQFRTAKSLLQTKGIQGSWIYLWPQIRFHVGQILVPKNSTFWGLYIWLRLRFGLEVSPELRWKYWELRVAGALQNYYPQLYLGEVYLVGGSQYLEKTKEKWQPLVGQMQFLEIPEAEGHMDLVNSTRLASEWLQLIHQWIDSELT